MLFWYFVISSTRRLSSLFSFLVLLLVLEINIFFFNFIPTLQLSSLFEIRDSLSFPPQKKKKKKRKRNTTFLLLFLLRPSPRRPRLLDKAPTPQARDRYRMRPSRTWTSARLSSHPGSLDPAYLHELGATASQHNRPLDLVACRKV